MEYALPHDVFDSLAQDGEDRRPTLYALPLRCMRFCLIALAASLVSPGITRGELSLLQLDEVTPNICMRYLAVPPFRSILPICLSVDMFTTQVLKEAMICFKEYGSD